MLSQSVRVGDGPSPVEGNIAEKGRQITENGTQHQGLIRKWWNGKRSALIPVAFSCFEKVFFALY